MVKCLKGVATCRFTVTCHYLVDIPPCLCLFYFASIVSSSQSAGFKVSPWSGAVLRLDVCKTTCIHAYVCICTMQDEQNTVFACHVYANMHIQLFD